MNAKNDDPACCPTKSDAQITNRWLRACTENSLSPNNSRLGGYNNGPKPTYLPSNRILKSELMLTHARGKCTQLHKQQSTLAEVQMYNGENVTALNSRHVTPVSIVSLLTISGPFNSLFKVLFIFPSRYLFAIGLSPIFSFR